LLSPAAHRVRRLDRHHLVTRRSQPCGIPTGAGTDVEHQSGLGGQQGL
jgi:hypothetical protein